MPAQVPALERKRTPITESGSEPQQSILNLGGGKECARGGMGGGTNAEGSKKRKRKIGRGRGGSGGGGGGRGGGGHRP